MLFRKTSMLSKIFTILLYGLVNLLLVLGLVSITKFNSHGVLQSQLPQILIIIFVTGLVDYIVINRKFLKELYLLKRG